MESSLILETDLISWVKKNIERALKIISRFLHFPELKSKDFLLAQSGQSSNSYLPCESFHLFTVRTQSRVSADFENTTWCTIQSDVLHCTFVWFSRFVNQDFTQAFTWKAKWHKSCFLRNAPKLSEFLIKTEKNKCLSVFLLNLFYFLTPLTFMLKTITIWY